jgi:hypothetical protein
LQTASRRAILRLLDSSSVTEIKKIMNLKKMVVVCLGSALLMSAAPFQSTTTTTTKATKPKKTTATTASKGKSETTANATPAQIAAAKSAGQVWVNTSTKVYHDSTSEFYGATKAGKFMVEKDAIAAGYHKSKSGN